jgi:hypothetical protein
MHLVFGRYTFQSEGLRAMCQLVKGFPKFTSIQSTNSKYFMAEYAKKKVIQLPHSVEPAAQP